MLKFIVWAVAAALFGSVASAQQVTVKLIAPGYTQADVEKAIGLFRRNCLPLGGEFWGDVIEIEATLAEETALYRQERGWKNSITLRVQYSDDPKFGPSIASGAGVLAGHSLFYILGGGDTPGFFASKRASQYLCGQSFSDRGDDLFTEVPELSFLD